MTKIAVTGAGGFVGRHLIPALAGQHHVRALARVGPSAREPGEDVDVVRGDVRNGDTVSALLQDTQVVVHMAGGFDAETEPETIVGGTAAVVTAARERGVSRIVFLSCLGAAADNPSPFFQAKWKAEQMIRSSGLPYVILRPSLILGRGDGVTAPLADLLRLSPVTPIPAPSDGRMQPVDVDDVIRCIAASLEGDAVANEEVSVGGPVFLTYRNLVDLISGHVGAARPKLALPIGLLPRLAGAVPGPWGALFAPARLALYAQSAVSSPGNVQRMFQFAPRSIIPEIPRYLGQDTGKLS